MTHSVRCSHDPTTYWDWSRNQCVPCLLRPGHEVTPNCGRDDDGGFHESGFRKCETNTFNDGSGPKCRRCSPCLSGTSMKTNCTSTSDSVCEQRTTSVPVTTLSPNPSIQPHVTTAVLLPSILLIVLAVVILVLFILFKTRRKRGQCIFFKRRLSLKNPGFAPISFSAKNSEDLGDILNENIMAAPLQTVLDNLDVLEDLVILLDPDTRGIKSTKHLASHCSFPASWITYTYSMKESKSPLRAVLEGITSKNPDWTVGHLAKILRQMDRNDAVTVLAKLKPSSQELNFF